MTTFIALREWQTLTPADDPRLRGLSLGGDGAAEQLAAALGETRRLMLVERRDGLCIETTSFVGTVRVGDVRLAIEPKLRGPALLRLLRYAYGLRHLDLYEVHGGAVDHGCFQDLLVHQLIAEVSELIARGLHRRYREREDQLTVPRGRIDFGRLAAQGGITTAALPCRHHVRDEDHLPNQVLLAGLLLAGQLAIDETLRLRVRRLARQMAETVSEVGLEPATFIRLERAQNRLIQAYQPSFALIQLLVQDRGASVTGKESIEIPGFLFDMNQFFERLVERFLIEHLPDCEVLGQERLRGLFSYDPAHNPRRRKDPTPRPDFVVLADGKPAAVLDAKYRDLWESALPREMLYQLAAYARSETAGGTVAIIYPTMSSDAREQRIMLRDPFHGSMQAMIALRPLQIEVLCELIAHQPSKSTTKARCTLANRLAFGSAPST